MVGRVDLLNAKFVCRVPRQKPNEWHATAPRRSGLIRKGNEHGDASSIQVEPKKMCLVGWVGLCVAKQDIGS